MLKVTIVDTETGEAVKDVPATVIVAGAYPNDGDTSETITSLNTCIAAVRAVHDAVHRISDDPMTRRVLTTKLIEVLIEGGESE